MCFFVYCDVCFIMRVSVAVVFGVLFLCVPFPHFVFLRRTIERKRMHDVWMDCDLFSLGTEFEQFEKRKYVWDTNKK